MNTALPDNVLEQINREQAHFSSAAPCFSTHGNAALKSPGRNGLATAVAKA